VPEGRRRRRTRPLLIVAAVLAGVLAVALLTATAYVWSLPAVSGAPARVAAIARAHHETLGPSEVPPKLAAAVVSVEDEHFYSNAVVNVGSGIGRAALAMLQGGGDTGGSTIPQQLAKALYGSGDGLGAKLRELGLGLRLSWTFPHTQVLAM
jgi:membrane peptidoglycan carboxypeptidase